MYRNMKDSKEKREEKGLPWNEEELIGEEEETVVDADEDEMKW